MKKHYENKRVGKFWERVKDLRKGPARKRNRKRQIEATLDAATEMISKPGNWGRGAQYMDYQQGNREIHTGSTYWKMARNGLSLKDGSDGVCRVCAEGAIHAVAPSPEIAKAAINVMQEEVWDGNRWSSFDIIGRNDLHRNIGGRGAHAKRHRLFLKEWKARLALVKEKKLNA